LLPLIDLINHHHPRKVFREDSISFQIKPVFKNSDSDDITKKKSYLTILTDSKFPNLGQEILYTYNPTVFKPYRLLEEYGFIVEDNQHGEVPLEIAYQTLPSNLQVNLFKTCNEYWEAH
jgi:hypothetical protein